MSRTSNETGPSVESSRRRIDGLRFDPGPDCVTGCTLTVDRYCDLSCMFVEPEPLRWPGDDA